MIVSFAWTTGALLAGRKTCTRRRWSDEYFQQWVRAYQEGRIVHDAYDRSPRAGGHKVAEIRLTCRPYWERLGDMPDVDVQNEGGLWASKQKFIELFGGDPEERVVVVRFRLIKERVQQPSLPLFELPLFAGVSND